MCKRRQERSNPARNRPALGRSPFFLTTCLDRQKGTFMENVFTLKQVATALRVSPPTARKVLRSGALPAVQAGRQWRCLEQSVIEYLRGGRSGDGQSEM